MGFSFNIQIYSFKEKQIKYLINLTLFIFITNICFSAEQTIKVSSFNIKFYGTGGSYAGLIGDEFRDKWIKQFIQTNTELSTSDVIVFQEIVDVEGLQNLLADQLKCISYKNNIQTNHQHVVICHKHSYDFLKHPGDDNYIIEESALTKYRPAVYGTLVDKNGTHLATIVAVHLKARQNSQAKRQKQAKIITEHLVNNRGSAPIIILGDFNTYLGDQDMISNNFFKLGLTHKFNFNMLTYNNGYFESILDHVWLDSRFKNSKLTVTGPCNKTDKESTYKTKQLNDLGFYNLFVSDHCPITITATI